MTALAIVQPLTFTASGGMTNPARVALADPKEAAVNGTALANTLDLDLGSSQSIDSLLIGYARNGTGASLTLSTGVSAHGETSRGSIAPAQSDLTEPARQYFFQSAPFNARYLRIGIPAAIGTTFQIGVAVVGKAFFPTWGTEYGAGRLLLDTGTVERLFGGGFGIDPGTIVSGYQWTFGDLQNAEREALFNICKRLGSTRSVLVIEDADLTNGLHNRIHWGLFNKLEAYERLNPADTKWSFQISDWG